MATPTTGSPNVTSLDSKIVADLCGGNFLVDVTPSVWIGTGYDNVQGASVKITNPVGVVINDYITSGFDIYPPMTSIFSFAIPLIAGNYQYGTYTIAVRLTDANGDTWVISKTVNICPPDPDNATRKYGCLDATLKGDCNTGELVVLLNNPPNYKGTAFSSQVNDLTLEYPTASGLSPLETVMGSFSVQLYEGQYKLTGTACVLYSYGDSVYFKVNYKVKCEKIIYCIIDECCVQAKLAELQLKVNSDCSQAQKDETASIALNALWLFQLAKLTAQCGEDPSDYIADLEKLLGCQCTCNCNEGTPVIGNYSSNLFLYKAILNQSSTDAPTAVESSLNQVTITWTRTSAGLYIGTLSGTYTALTEANTFVQINSSSFIQSSPTAQSFIKAGYNAADSIYVRSNDLTGTAADALIKNIPIVLSILA
ncbi:MAG TPA: hypothetical protein PLX17_02295 [Chitinophagaceae bacterium]|nr:hypothetical protein [Chitinophagaceae bacterium]